MSDWISIWSQHRDMLPRFWTLVYMQIPLYTPRCVHHEPICSAAMGQDNDGNADAYFRIVGSWTVKGWSRLKPHCNWIPTIYQVYFWPRWHIATESSVVCLLSPPRLVQIITIKGGGGGIRFDMLHFVTMQCDLIQW